MLHEGSMATGLQCQSFFFGTRVPFMPVFMCLSVLQACLKVMTPVRRWMASARWCKWSRTRESGERHTAQLQCWTESRPMLVSLLQQQYK